MKNILHYKLITILVSVLLIIGVVGIEASQAYATPDKWDPAGTGTTPTGVPDTQSLTTVTVNAPDQGLPDTDFTVTIEIDSVNDLHAIQYDITFDSSVLRLDDITGGLIDSTMFPVPTGDISPRELIPGHWRVVQFLETDTVNGSGYLSALHFHVIGSPGESSMIELSDGIVSSIDGEISTQFVDDFIVITSTSPIHRNLPPCVVEGGTFEVTINFTSQSDGFNAIGLSDFAPPGWIVTVNDTWCSPAPMTSQAVGNRADYVWGGPYATGQEFTAVYQVTVPPGTSPGLYCFTGNIEYYIDTTGPMTAPVSGDFQVTAVEGVEISGTTYEAKGIILDGVTVTIDGGASVVSSVNGTYQIIATTTGNHTVTASKAVFRNQSQVIEITDICIPYTLDFKGNNGLIPDAPDISYVLACINKWIAPPGDGCLEIPGVVLPIIRYTNIVQKYILQD